MVGGGSKGGAIRAACMMQVRLELGRGAGRTCSETTTEHRDRAKKRERRTPKQKESRAGNRGCDYCAAAGAAAGAAACSPPASSTVAAASPCLICSTIFF